jgi:hypothetical protein
MGKERGDAEDEVQREGGSISIALVGLNLQ